MDLHQCQCVYLYNIFEDLRQHQLLQKNTQDGEVWNECYQCRSSLLLLVPLLRGWLSSFPSCRGRYGNGNGKSKPSQELFGIVRANQLGRCISYFGDVVTAGLLWASLVSSVVLVCSTSNDTAPFAVARPNELYSSQSRVMTIEL